MIGGNLTGRDRRVYDLHRCGYTMRQISRLTGRPLEDVRGVITGAWYDHKKATSGGR